MLAHGASYLLHERLCTSSDEYKMNVCNECQTLTEIIVDSDGNMMCKRCIRSNKECETNIEKITTTYSTRLLITYLAGLGIKVKFIKEKKEEEEEEVEIEEEERPEGQEEEPEEEEEEEEIEEEEEEIEEEPEED
jgi:hypothetical protein